MLHIKLLSLYLAILGHSDISAQAFMQQQLERIEFCAVINDTVCSIDKLLEYFNQNRALP